MNICTGRKTILLVDDEHLLRKMLAELLRKAGYDVLEADSALEAVRIAKGHARSVDILVSDVVLAERSGPELLTELRSLEPTLPAVLMSGHDPEIVRQKNSIPSDILVLEKPFEHKSLLIALQNLQVTL